MIVTTEITAVTPTTIPISVSAVRSLFWRKLAPASRNASQTAAMRSAGNDLTRAGKASRLPKMSGSLCVSLRGRMAALLYLLVFFDEAVTNRDDAKRPARDVVFVRDKNNCVAVFVESFEEVHDVVTGGRIQRTSRFIREQDRRVVDERARNRH